MEESKSVHQAADSAGRDALVRALRPPVNSVLALAKLLADNEERNLSAKQIDYAQTIYSAGTQLLGVLDGLLAHGKDETAGSAAVAPIALQPPAVRIETARPYRGRRGRRPDDGFVLIAHRDAAIAAALLARVRENGCEGELATDLVALQAMLARRKPDAIIIGPALEDTDAQGALAALEAGSGARPLPARLVLGHEGIEEVLAQTTRFLREAVGMPLPPRRRILAHRRKGPLDLAGKKVLIVDRDICNIYAMTGVLEQEGMLVLHAESGSEGMAVLENNPDMDAVLLDATPEPGGYGTIRLMRGQARCESLPVIALTAGTGLDQREQCMAAGASDSLAKPVDEAQLIALLRAWLLTPR